MKDFDIGRRVRASDDRLTFKIGGETFTRKASVPPEDMAAWEDHDPRFSTTVETLAVVDETVFALIEDWDGAHERWRALRERREDALSYGDVLDVVKWLVEEQAARPTELSSDSSNGRTPPGTRSTGVFSLPVAAAPTS